MKVWPLTTHALTDAGEATAGTIKFNSVSDHEKTASNAGPGVVKVLTDYQRGTWTTAVGAPAPIGAHTGEITVPPGATGTVNMVYTLPVVGGDATAKAAHVI